jgi:hypothetical protein
MKNEAEFDMEISGIDSFLPIEKAQKDILSRVDTVIDNAVKEKNPDIAAKAMKGLLGVSQMSGLAFSKFVYVMSFQWPNFGRRGTYETWAEDEFGRGKTTIKRNFRVWEMLVSGDVPKEYAEKLKFTPVRCLIPIANMWSQGYEVESNQWMKLANAPDPTTINKIIREIKGVEPKKGSIQIEMDGTGNILAWKDGKSYTVGYLFLDSTEEVVQKAIERLVSTGRMMEK